MVLGDGEFYQRSVEEFEEEGVGFGEVGWRGVDYGDSGDE